MKQCAAQPSRRLISPFLTYELRIRFLLDSPPLTLRLRRYSKQSRGREFQHFDREKYTRLAPFYNVWFASNDKRLKELEGEEAAKAKSAQRTISPRENFDERIDNFEATYSFSRFDGDLIRNSYERCGKSFGFDPNISNSLLAACATLARQ